MEISCTQGGCTIVLEPDALSITYKGGDAVCRYRMNEKQEQGYKSDQRTEKSVGMHCKEKEQILQHRDSLRRAVLVRPGKGGTGSSHVVARSERVPSVVCGVLVLCPGAHPHDP